jgi:hypothetical protein
MVTSIKGSPRLTESQARTWMFSTMLAGSSFRICRAAPGLAVCEDLRLPPLMRNPAGSLISLKEAAELRDDG